ncbi:MAG: RidA family protein [Burkholderiaceae bacterium]|jgi:2-iminobutanoate/2-iminopropanoate deaminase
MPVSRYCVSLVHRLAAATGLSLLLAVPALAANAKQAYPSPDLPDLPYSAAVRAGDTIYVSGVLGHAPGSPKPVPGGVRAESEQALTHIQSILKTAGSTMENVVKCTVLLADINGFPEMNAAYRKFFPSQPPARSTIIVPALPHNALVEIECNALVAN